MKKRIISIALVVAMVVAMIPAALVSVLAAPYTGHGDGYDVYVSEEELTLDGQMDAAYNNSEKIVDGHHHTNGASFEAYAAVTSTGFYLFANVKDSTVDVAGESAVAAGTGDKSQVYIQVANAVTTGEGDNAVTTTHYDWAYYDCDYAHTAAVQNANVKTASTVVEGGYTFEICIPWSVFTDITNGFSLNTCKVWFGFQVNNYTLSGTNTGLVVDNPGTMSYWSGDFGGAGTTAPSKFMIPANLIKSAKVVKDLKYQSFVTDEAITLDGKRDDIYLASEKITSKQISNGTYGETAGFNTWLVAREDGFYIFASIYDDTLDKAEAVENGLRAQDGDKFQIYLQLGNNVWTRWGYIDFDYVDGGRHLTTKQTLGYSADGIQQKAVIWDNNKGWDIEIFLPHNISVDNRMATDINSSWNDVLMKINFQALNETCTDWTETGYCTARNRYGLAYDIAEAGSAWNGPSNASTYFVPVDFSIDPYSMPGTGAVTYNPSVTIDGTKDAGYGDDTLAFVLDKNRSSNFTSENGNEYAKAWVTVTNTQVALYALVHDTTIHATTSRDSIVLYTYFPLTNTGTYFGGGYARSGHIETTTRWGASAFNSTNGDGASGIGETQAMKSLGDGWYAIEFAMNLPSAERQAIARGETVNIGIGIQHRDYDTSGTNGALKAYNRNGYESYWNSATYTKNSMQRFAVNQNTTATNLATVDPTVTGANVALGESITVNYYATVPAYAENVSMKYTMNGEVSFIKGVPTGTANQYKFAFTGIAPQCIGDEIDAELYIGGDSTGDTIADYSVRQNVLNLVAGDDDLMSNDTLEQLVYDLLAYGAAAQNYANYKTGALVNAGCEEGTAAGYELPTANDKTITAALADAKFTAAGVYHANANKLYAKIKADDISKVTATIDGEAVKIEKYAPTGEYIIYSEDIKVTDFDRVYTFEITTEAGTQTLTYSVNTWCTVKSGANNDRVTTQALAYALYAYGVAADDYNG